MTEARHEGGSASPAAARLLSEDYILHFLKDRPGASEAKRANCSHALKHDTRRIEADSVSPAATRLLSERTFS
jgi:hypothetical protein